MTFRAKMILIIAAILVLVGIAYGISVLLSNQAAKKAATNTTEQATPTTDTTTTPTTDQTDTSTTTPSTSASVSQPLPEIKGTESDLVGIAMPFVERMGSYSNQGGYSNLESLLPFMSASMKTWAQGQITNSKKAGYQNIYTGITTKVLSYKIPRLSDTSAEIQLTAQRSESVGSATNTKVYNQDVMVQMVKEDGVWLVDVVDWK